MRHYLTSLHESICDIVEFGVQVSHPLLEGKPNANHVRARIRTHVHRDYIIGNHHTMLEINSGKVLYYNKMSKTSIESIT
jgi:tryptophan synthase alpha subunit